MEIVRKNGIYDPNPLTLKFIINLGTIYIELHNIK